MKKNLWMLLMGLLLLPMTAVLTSCGDDDDDQKPTSDNPLIGTWSGFYIDEADYDDIFNSTLDKNDAATITFTSDFKIAGRLVYVDDEDPEESYDGKFTGTYELNVKNSEVRLHLVSVADPDDTEDTGWQKYQISGNKLVIDIDGYYLMTR